MLKNTISIGIMLALSSASYAASFDCKKAKTKIEQTVCKNPKLSKLDEELSKLYQPLVEHAASAKHVRRTQQFWLKMREEHCPDADAECLIANYQNRIEVLTFRLHEAYQAAPTASIAGIYKGGENMEMLIEAESYDSVLVHIEGSESTRGRWSCSFTGRGALKNNQVVAVVLGDVPEADNPVTLKIAKKSVITVDEGNKTVFCGAAGGSLNGEYKRQP